MADQDSMGALINTLLHTEGPSPAVWVLLGILGKRAWTRVAEGLASLLSLAHRATTALEQLATRNKDPGEVEAPE